MATFGMLTLPAQSRRRRAPARKRHDDIGPIGNQRVDAPVQQPARVRLGVDRPDLHAEPAAWASRDEPPRDDARPARPFRHLIAGVADARHRPAAPRSVERPADLLARRAGRDRRLEAPRFAQHRRPNDPRQTRSTASARRTTSTTARASSGSFDLHLDDDRHVAITRRAPPPASGRRRRWPRNGTRSRRVADSLRAGRKKYPASARASSSAVRFAIGPVRFVVRSSVAVVVHDDDAVARQVHVELEPIGAERQAVVERGDRVLRRERAAAAMREHQRPRRAERKDGATASVV